MAALILLFVYVFGVIGQHPATSVTPTVMISTATATPSKQGGPTATPGLVQVPTFTPSVPAAQAWRGFTPTKSLTFKPNGKVAFIPDIFSSDMTAVGGVLYDTGGSLTARLAYYTIATGKLTALSPTWHGVEPAGAMRGMDSRFIVYSYDLGCGACGSSIWSLDRATGKTWNINQGIGGEREDYVSNDHAVFATIAGQVWVADLAAHTVKVALPIGTKPYTLTSQRTVNDILRGFQWPYLMYEESPFAPPPAQQVTTLNVLDLATGVNTRVQTTTYDQNGAPLDPSLDGVTTMALAGKTLYAIVGTNLDGVDAHGTPVNLAYGTLYRLDDFTAGGKFGVVARWPFPSGDTFSVVDLPTMATRHLIWLGSGYFWDSAESRLVSTDLNYAQLIGSDLVTTDAFSDAAALQTFHAEVYDTSRFPVPPGF